MIARTLVCLVCLTPQWALAQTLVDRQVLPADTLAEGPPSGARLGAAEINGVSLPLPQQPVQGFSALVRNDDGTLLVLSDNGYGSIQNSADYRLRLYTIAPGPVGEGGSPEVLKVVTLRDPHHHVPWAITEHWSEARCLTGADFDVESLQRAPDGTLWLGDEFGPFLLHVDANGELLEPPLPLLDEAGGELASPQSPRFEEGSALRVLNALTWRARQHGARPPVFSPWDLMLADGDAATGLPSRSRPPEGLEAAGSEVFDLELLHAAGYRVVPYTVNSADRMRALLALGVDGIISDDPALLREVVAAWDADGDGAGGDLLDADGLLDAQRFDAQGHRGARNLRPENTLPAFEAALDHLVSTLETDCGVTRDGVPVLCHEPYVSNATFRRSDGASHDGATLIKDLTLADLQASYVGDVKQLSRPKQSNDLSLSPVTVAFAEARGLPHAYVMPSLAQLFDFVEFYRTYYADGPGRQHADAAPRAKNAARVRFNVETKLNPQDDEDSHGHPRSARTVGPEALARAVADAIVAADLSARADVQSFDLRTVLVVQEHFPQLGTIWLAGDFPLGSSHGDGTNLQRHGDAPTRWLAGLPWPYRRTLDRAAGRVPTSGGFEGLALTPDGERLLAMQEKPLVGQTARTLTIHTFEIAQRTWTGPRWSYPLDARGTAIGAFQVYAPGRGLVIERDDTQGDLDGFKRVFQIDLPPAGGPVTKRLVLDLLQIAAPDGRALAVDGDVGLGERFAFPFVTIECLAVLSPTRLLIANDNNYPFSVGRHLTPARPDDNELIWVELAEPLPR